MTVRVSAKKVAGKALGVLSSRGGASAMRPASIGAMTALRPTQQQCRTVFSKERSKSVYEYGAHRSDAEARIAEVPVVMVDGPVALCDGGAWGVGIIYSRIHGSSTQRQPALFGFCCRPERRLSID